MAYPSGNTHKQTKTEQKGGLSHPVVQCYCWYYYNISIVHHHNRRRRRIWNAVYKDDNNITPVHRELLLSNVSLYAESQCTSSQWICSICSPPEHHVYHDTRVGRVWIVSWYHFITSSNVQFVGPFTEFAIPHLLIVRGRFLIWLFDLRNGS